MSHHRSMHNIINSKKLLHHIILYYILASYLTSLLSNVKRYNTTPYKTGRCTLLSALMQQQIMMLESIIAAYTLSALSLHNARSSERQMMASNWYVRTCTRICMRTCMHSYGFAYTIIYFTKIILLLFLTVF